MIHRVYRNLTLLLVALMLSVLTGTTGATPLPMELRHEIEARLTSGVHPPAVWLGGALELDGQFLPEFYDNRQYAPAWLDELGLTTAAYELLRALRDSSAHGLCSDDFHLSYLEPLVQLERDSHVNGILFDAHYLAILDLLLSDSFFRYAEALTGGQLPAAFGKDRALGMKALPSLLQKNLAAGRFARLLSALEPQQQGYRRMLQALHDLRDLSAYGGWPQVPHGQTLRKGDRGKRVQLLKARLFTGGDLEDAAAWGEPGLGELTVKGVRSFQERHGLNADGVAGPLTLAEMNVPVEERIRQVELNLMRWRRAPVEFGTRHIRVNVADFTLEVHDRGEIVMSMPVVVGTPYRKTPTFSAKMSYLEFAPYWYVPATILREDKLPLIKRDPGWLSRHHYEIISWNNDALLDPLKLNWSNVTEHKFPGSLRMRPGPWNPLGRVKFMFPNRYAIYLHDTNERQLFSRGERFFSSGCIRIERPLDLAQFLLEAIPGWDCESIIDAMEGDETVKVKLPEEVPVHLLYWTAWVDEHERLQFRRDIYLRDADLEAENLKISEQRQLRNGGSY